MDGPALYLYPVLVYNAQRETGKEKEGAFGFIFCRSVKSTLYSALIGSAYLISCRHRNA